MDLFVLFKNYLLSINALNKESKASYLSYFKNATIKLLDDYVKRFGYDQGFERLLLGLGEKEKEALLLLSDRMLSSLIDGKRKEGTIKTYSNYRASLRCLIGMFYSDGIPVYGSSAIPAAVATSIKREYLNVSDKTFSKSDLDFVYLSRLKTQDRWYKGVMMFPIRLIWSICRSQKREKELKKTILKTLYEMKYYVNFGTRFVEHRNVQSLVFDKGGVLVNGKMKLYSPTPKGDFVAIKGTMKDISIDHITPLYDYLTSSQAPKDYPTLKKLSDGFEAFLNKNHCKSLSAKMSAKFFDETKTNYGTDFVNAILADMEKLFGAMSFQIMERKLNSSKNKKPSI